MEVAQRRVAIGERTLVVEYDRGRLADPERMDAAADALVQAILGVPKQGCNLKDGLRIGFGWSMVTLVRRGEQLHVHEPDFSTDPFSRDVPGATATLCVYAEQAEFAARAKAAPAVSRFSDQVRVAPGVLDVRHAAMRRVSAASGGESGWSIETGPESPGTEPTWQWVYAFELWNRGRLDLLRPLLLPPGWSVAVDEVTVRVQDPVGVETQRRARCEQAGRRPESGPAAREAPPPLASRVGVLAFVCWGGFVTVVPLVAFWSWSELILNTYPVLDWWALLVHTFRASISVLGVLVTLGVFGALAMPGAMRSASSAAMGGASFGGLLTGAGLTFVAVFSVVGAAITSRNGSLDASPEANRWVEVRAARFQRYTHADVYSLEIESWTKRGDYQVVTVTPGVYEKACKMIKDAEIMPYDPRRGPARTWVRVGVRSGRYGHAWISSCSELTMGNPPDPAAGAQSSFQIP